MASNWVDSKKALNEITDDLVNKLETVWLRLPPSQEIRDLAHQRLLIRYRSCVEAFLKEEEQVAVEHQILVLRQRIDDLWKLCCYTDSQKDDFPEYNNATFSKESLEKHRQYLSSLELLYKNNELLFNSTKKYTDLWQHIQDLNKQLSDPNRLFTNRGALLLKNEKDLKEGKKELIHLEADLIRLTAQHEEKYGTQLLIHGETVITWLQKFKPQNATGSTCKSRVRPWHTGMASTAKKRSCAAGTTNGHVPAKQCKRSLQAKVNDM